VGERRGGAGYLFAAVLIPTLVRWSLLRDAHHRLHSEGTGEDDPDHVVCPEPGCTNENWETLYSPTTVTKCGLHGGSRVRMVLCEDCRRERGFHPVPERRP
jgi:hypothetical protein